MEKLIKQRQLGEMRILLEQDYRIYFNSSRQLDNVTDKISRKGRVYFTPGETMVKETMDYNGEIMWLINVKKIQIK